MGTSQNSVFITHRSFHLRRIRQHCDHNFSTLRRFFPARCRFGPQLNKLRDMLRMMIRDG